ncbi:MAG: hypothetical protein LDLANPLL_01251 [Turneriella sp.]|nr:hypothetical protein [Turneriella sp.]
MKVNTTSQFLSTIAIDLGGKNTGVLLTHGASDEAPHQHEKRALTLSYPEAGLNLSQQSRLAKRHQRRGFKRRKLSKRLLALLLRQKYRGSLEEFAQDFDALRTFLNRRGYTYLTLDDAEEQTEFLNGLSAEVYEEVAASLKEFQIDTAKPLVAQLEKSVERELDWYTRLAAVSNEVRNKKEIPQFSDEKQQKDHAREYKKVFTEIVKYCERVLKSEKEGHKTRSEYLQNIREDLASIDASAVVARFGLPSEQLANLVGHIANMQLRVLRRYFNDKAMQESDYWDEKRLQHIFQKHLKSWHVTKKNAEYANRETLLATIASKGLLQSFLNENPTLSIPPFEDQNNRRVPRCRSLHLDAEALDSKYPNWRDMAAKIVAYTGYEYELDLQSSELKHIEEAYKKSAGNDQFNKNTPGREKSAEVILLQRILDRSKDADKFHLRILCRVEELFSLNEADQLSESDKKKHASGMSELTKALGDDKSVKAIIDLAQMYFQEVERAKRGLWLSGEAANICYRCDRKPRQKKNIKHELIGNILGASMPKESDLWQKWEALYKEKATVGRSSLSSVCKSIEETRKDMGDRFHIEWNQAKYAKKRGAAPTVSADLVKILAQTESAALVIANLLGHTAKEAERYRNPYSLAQIYNIMEGEIGGFQTTCTGCTHDNFWRSARAAATNEETARAVRLPADTMRPFDGYLARYLERIAAQIAKEKWRQIEATPRDAEINVAILLEQNRFRFNADLAEMKDAARKKQAKEKLVRAEERSADKTDRIRKASKGVCPYTGAPLTSGGEIDHILPRSYSKSAFGAIFNSEMNLIYCSSEGNRKKANKHYRLENLHDKYLQAVFNTANRAEIRKTIQETLGKFDKKEPVYFSSLDAKEQRDFRHALFDDELSRRVRPLLHAEYKMRVSGMQGYLARILFQKLQERNAQAGRNLHFSVQAYDAEQISLKRNLLEGHNKAYAKPKDSAQAPGSHVIDATMIWAEALYRNDVRGRPTDLKLEELLPDNLQIRSLESRPQYRRKRPHTMAIFNDTIYAERYLSFVVTKKECGFGYDMKNMTPIPEAHSEAIFELVKPFVHFRGETPKHSLAEYRTKLNAQKKFLYFNVHRQSAARLQQQIAHSPVPTATQANQLIILQGIRYFTLKEPVLGAMADKGDKAVALSQKKLDNLSTKTEFSLSLDGKKCVVKGVVKLPQRDAWERVVSDKLVKSFVKDGKKWTDLSDEQRDAFHDRHFKQEIKNKKAHHGVRKVYSLPLIPIPAGFRFRINRAHGIDEHFQVYAKKSAAYSGFPANALDTSQVDFSAPELMPFLRKPTLTPVDGVLGVAPEKIVFMDEWRSIPLADVGDKSGQVIALWMAPNSDSRCRIRVQLKSEALVEETAVWHLTAPLAYNIIKPSETPHIKAVEKKMSVIFGALELKPRDGKIQLYAVDRESTTLEFVVQGTSSLHKTWYNAGTPI